jgi:MFS family permease
MSTETGTPPAVGADDRRRWFALGVIVTAQFMVVLDISIVNVALPSIKTDLHFSQESLQWVITAYSIFFGGFLLLGGRLADLFGRRRLLMAGLALFTVSSLLNGLAWSEASLIAFRCLQGLGAAMMSPAALSILTTTFQEGRERNRALGIWGAVAGSGGAVGVLLGGVLTSAFSWPWIFFVNVPVGVAALAVTPVLVRESRAELPYRYFDLAGAATITAGLMLLVYGMTRATQHGWGTPATIGLLTASVVLIASFFLIESRSKAPLLPLRIFRLRTLAGSNLLSAQDRGRLHRADVDDHRLLGSLTGTRDEARGEKGAAGRVGALRGGARALRAGAGARPLLPQSVPRLHHQRPRAGLRIHTDVDRRTHRSPPGGCRNRVRVDQHKPADRRGDRRRCRHDDRDDGHEQLRALPRPCHRA